MPSSKAKKNMLGWAPREASISLPSSTSIAANGEVAIGGGAPGGGGCFMMHIGRGINY